MTVPLKSLLPKVKKINCLVKKIAEANANKHKSNLLKWNKIDNQLTPYNEHFFDKRISLLLSTPNKGWMDGC